jgi:hypothetical protein
MRLLWIVFLLVVSTTYARLGETEKQILLQRPAAIATVHTKLDGGGSLLIIEDKDTEYTAGFLDGKCEVEVYRNLDDSMLKESFIVGELKAYSQTWIPIPCSVHDCLAAISADRKYISKLGYSRTLDKYHTFSVFTARWHTYAEKIVEKAIAEKKETL